jgi:predicted dehydrogenase
MSSRFSRRQLLKQTAVAAGAAATAGMFPVPAILAGASPNSTPGIAVIGCTNQGYISVGELGRLGERIVAFCDVDDKNLAKAKSKLAADYPETKVDAIQTFFDYRKMLDAIGRQIDAVFVCIPDHHHAVAAMMAMKAGKSVYVEKPLAHSIAECRALAAAAKKYDVTTQMGNQGHSREGIRVLCEYLWAGAIGNVLETHHWAPTGRGGTGGRPAPRPLPETLHWDEWIGPAHFRDYHADLHPGRWRSWWEFGDGSVGDWGCHNLDGAFWALDLGHPTSIEVLEQTGGSDERYPLVNVIRWNFPARGKLPPVKVHWYDGYHGLGSVIPKELGEEVLLAKQNRPPIVAELEKKYNRHFGDGGTIFVGEKGILSAGNYCEGPRIVPEEEHRKFPRPEKKLPRLKGSHQQDFLRALKEGKKSCSDFAYTARLTEMALLGCLAERAGVGKQVQWDGENMKCTNLPELNALVNREHRPGWEL